MKTLILWLAKKYIVGGVNDLLEKNKDSVAEISSSLKVWIARLQIVLDALKNINARVSDSKLDDEEIKDSVKEIETIVKEW